MNKAGDASAASFPCRAPAGILCLLSFSKVEAERSTQSWARRSTRVGRPNQHHTSGSVDSAASYPSRGWDAMQLAWVLPMFHPEMEAKALLQKEEKMYIFLWMDISTNVWSDAPTSIDQIAVRAHLDSAHPAGNFMWCKQRRTVQSIEEIHTHFKQQKETTARRTMLQNIAWEDGRRAAKLATRPWRPALL